MTEPPSDPTPRDASPHTHDRNVQAAAVLSFDDKGDWERARRGLITTIESGRIALGEHVVWDVANYDFVRESEVPHDTVHPGLWRQARLNCIHGLFEVGEGALGLIPFRYVHSANDKAFYLIINKVGSIGNIQMNVRAF